MPKQESALARPEVTMSVMDAIYKRHAVRSYTAKKVDEKAIKLLLDAAVHAPTAMHEEPWAFAVIQDKTVLKRLSESAKQLLGAIEGHGHAFAHFLQPDASIFYNATTLIVIYGKPVGSFVVADCWLAAENLMLTATSMGLGTCVIGLAVAALNTPEWKKELGIPVEMTAFAPIIIGTPSGKTPDVTRKAPEVLIWK